MSHYLLQVGAANFSEVGLEICRGIWYNIGMKINKGLVVFAVLVGVAIGTYMGINRHLETLRHQADARSKTIRSEYYAAAKMGRQVIRGRRS